MATKYSYNLFRRDPNPTPTQNQEEPDQNTAVAPTDPTDVEMEEPLPLTSSLLATSSSSSAPEKSSSSSSVQRRPFREALWKNFLFIWSPKQNSQVDNNDNEPILKLPSCSSSPDLSSSSTSAPHSKVYVELLERENARLKSFLQEILPAFQESQSDSMSLEESFKVDVLTLYDTTILDLKQELKNFSQLMDDMQQTHHKEKEELVKRHESEMEETIARMARDNNELIDEILSKSLEEIEQWKSDFERETKLTLVPLVAGQNLNGENSVSTFVLDVDELLRKPKDNAAIQLYKQFSDLGPVTQVLVVAGIGIIGLVFGYYSWPFISWAWPRLLAFAARIELSDVLVIYSYINTWATSREFQEFKQAWEDGESLQLILQKFGSESISMILSLAPALFKKTRIPV